jgi:hypothetical protein
MNVMSKSIDKPAQISLLSTQNVQGRYRAWITPVPRTQCRTSCPPFHLELVQGRFSNFYHQQPNSVPNMNLRSHYPKGSSVARTKRASANMKLVRVGRQVRDLPHARNLRADARPARIFRREITTYDESYPASHSDELLQSIIRQRVAKNAFVPKPCGAQKNAHFANVDKLPLESRTRLAVESRTATLGRRK